MSSWGYRVCASCGHDLHRDEYSTNQWNKYCVGMSRCRVCVEEGVSQDSTGFSTARTNNSTRLRCDFSCGPFAEGSFRWCYSGEYTGGQRTGQRCVVKRFKNEQQSLASIRKDLYAVEKAEHIITQWNQAGFSKDFIRINRPDHWTISGFECLVEPWINGFFKINSNTGWTTDEDDDQVDMLQALSHYSYHVSSGQFVLCDLQGGCYRDGIILTDPVIMSRDGRFGATDLGPDGISTFFYYHTCTDYCDDRWTQPRNQRPVYRQTSHTTMSFSHF